MNDNDLINFNQKTKATKKGIIIYKPESILVTDKGYNILSATNLTEINNYFNENKKDFSNPSIINSAIVGNGQIGNNNNRIIFKYINKNISIQIQRNKVLSEFSQNLISLSDDDILQLRGFLNSISENGNFDRTRLKSFLNGHPNLKKGFDTIIQIISESGKSFAVKYIKTNFPGIF